MKGIGIPRRLKLDGLWVRRPPSAPVCTHGWLRWIKAPDCKSGIPMELRRFESFTVHVAMMQLADISSSNLEFCEFESRSPHQVCGRGGIWQTHHSQKVAVNSHIGSSPIVRTSFGQVKGIGIPSWPRTNCLGVRSPSCPPILRSWRNGSRAGLRKTRRCPAFSKRRA